mgnify:FL=1
MSIRHSRRRLIVAAVVVAVAMTPVLSGCSQVALAVAGAMVRAQEAPPQPPVEVEDTDNDMAFEYLGVGDCFDDPYAEGGMAGDGPWPVLLIPCDDPHSFELYAKSDLGASHFPDAMSPTAEFPGDDEVGEAADEVCYDAFDDFVGESYEDSTLDYWYYPPVAESWAHGDRLVRCAVGYDDETISWSVEGSGRTAS